MKKARKRKSGGKKTKGFKGKSHSAKSKAAISKALKAAWKGKRKSGKKSKFRPRKKK